MCNLISRLLLEQGIQGKSETSVYDHGKSGVKEFLKWSGRVIGGFRCYFV